MSDYPQRGRGGGRRGHGGERGRGGFDRGRGTGRPPPRGGHQGGEERGRGGFRGGRGGYPPQQPHYTVPEGPPPVLAPVASARNYVAPAYTGPVEGLDHLQIINRPDAGGTAGTRIRARYELLCWSCLEGRCSGIRTHNKGGTSAWASSHSSCFLLLFTRANFLATKVNKDCVFFQ